MPTFSSERLATARATIELLAEQFPRCFAVYEGRRRPLKLKIHIDILAAADGAITPTELGDALQIYVSNSSYLRACREGVPRIDLSGQPIGAVSAEDAARAATQLAARKLRRAAQKKAQVAEPEPVKPEPMESRPKRLGLDALEALGISPGNDIKGESCTDEPVPQKRRAVRNPTTAPIIIAATAIKSVVILRRTKAPTGAKTA